MSEKQFNELDITPDAAKPFNRICFHCGTSFWVGLKFQTDIAPDSAWNICPKCVEAIANGSCSEELMQSLGF